MTEELRYTKQYQMYYRLTLRLSLLKSFSTVFGMCMSVNKSEKSAPFRLVAPLTSASFCVAI